MSPRRLLPLLALPLLAGCAAISRPSATTASIYASGPAVTAAHRTLVDSVTTRLARRAKARGDHTLDILLLSGGGQNGAYGAGFLRGWRARPDQPMPTFDLVTGEVGLKDFVMSDALEVDGSRIELPHPRTGRPLALEAALPPELEAVLARRR